MVRPRKLTELSHLRETGFGQPCPRHGLILLWWFADECVEIDSNRMIACCDPKDRAFGFHPFHNSEGILPDTDLQYYEMGNLHHPGAMPPYVTKYYNRYVHESNADRIVVSVNSKRNKTWFKEIYVTHHLGQGRFDENSTYQISQGLIDKIQSLKWPDFIRNVKIRQHHHYWVNMIVFADWILYKHYFCSSKIISFWINQFCICSFIQFHYVLL